MDLSLPALRFFRRMSARERTLSLLVAGALLLVANLVAISTLLHSSRDLRTQIVDKSQELHVQNLYAQEQPMWKTRTDWLKKTQPALAFSNHDRAGADLEGEVQAAARVNRVVLTNPQIIALQPAVAGERVAQPEYQTVSVSVETQSDWSALVQFLVALQRPDNFLVFDRATLRSDPSDPLRMKGAFTVSKWYAPGAK